MTAPEAPTGRSRTLAFALLTLVALSWAANTIVARATTEEVPPLALTFWRLALSAAVFAPFVLRDAWRRRHAILRNIVQLNLLAALQMTAFNALVYSGLHHTEAINGTLLQGALPLCILLAGPLFARQAVTARQAACMALGLSGLLTIVVRGDIDALLGLSVHAGDPLVFLGVFSSAVYTVLLARRPGGLPMPTFVFLMLAFGAVQAAPLHVAEHLWVRPLPVTAEAAATIVFIALVPSAMAQWCFAEGVRRVGAATAGHMIYLVPVFGVLMAVALLGESFQTFHAVGTALIAGGIWAATVRGGGRPGRRPGI